jgi:hypothetical protein
MISGTGTFFVLFVLNLYSRRWILNHQMIFTVDLFVDHIPGAEESHLPSVERIGSKCNSIRIEHWQWQLVDIVLQVEITKVIWVHIKIYIHLPNGLSCMFSEALIRLFFVLIFFAVITMGFAFIENSSISP